MGDSTEDFYRTTYCSEVIKIRGLVPARDYSSRGVLVCLARMGDRSIGGKSFSGSGMHKASVMLCKKSGLNVSKKEE
ncbi:MAG: hypothetical protein ABH869_02840 [Candidatus Omnitrophota bacterium]